MSKVLNKLSKKKRLQNKKKKLVEKIQKCKKFSEVKHWEKTMEYYPVLAEDEDYDYGFLLDLISFKLKRMSNYFHTHNIVVNEERWAKLCDIAIKLLDIGYLNEIVLDDDLKEIYVNTKNKHRFLSKRMLEMSDVLWNKYGKATIRTEKAKKLFWKFMYHYIEYLWD